MSARLTFFMNKAKSFMNKLNSVGPNIEPCSTPETSIFNSFSILFILKGTIYCAIRSVKHSGTSVFHHLQGMQRIMSLDVFDGNFINNMDEAKPGMIVTVDGCLDENLWYTKNYF